MRTNNQNKTIKYTEIASYIKLEQPFSGGELCAAFTCSKTIPYALHKAGFLKKLENGLFVASEKGKDITDADIDAANKRYTSELPSALKTISANIQTMSPIEYLRLQKGNDCKEMANEIFKIIKKYLN